MKRNETLFILSTLFFLLAGLLYAWGPPAWLDAFPYSAGLRFLLALDPAERDRCFFLDGLTKSLGASNVRSAHLLASTKAVKFMQNRASHGVIPSFHSLAVAMAVHAAQIDKGKLCALLLLAAALMGVAFLGVKSLEYYRHFEEGSVPGPYWHLHAPAVPGVQMFFYIYFVMTGLHALHEDMPDVFVRPIEPYDIRRLPVRLVEQQEEDLACELGVQSEVHARGLDSCAKRVPLTRRDSSQFPLL